MDAVAAIYRLASSLSPGNNGLRTRVEFHRRGRFDATITLVQLVPLLYTALEFPVVQHVHLCLGPLYQPFATGP